MDDRDDSTDSRTDSTDLTGSDRMRAEMDPRGERTEKSCRLEKVTTVQKDEKKVDAKWWKSENYSICRG